MTIEMQTREKVDLVRIDEINVLNPRSRNRRVHRELIENIKTIGLKRPITVSPTSSADGQRRFDLICGQGRLEAYQALGQIEIPAFVIEASEEDCLVMSLVENVARRQHSPIELMREVGRLRERGDSDSEIAERIGVTPSWINMISGLLERGEERLLAAVETGLIPLSMATSIARGTHAEIQHMLADAYEQGVRGRKLNQLRRLLEKRTDQKLVSGSRMGPARKQKNFTHADIRRMFEKEGEKQRLIVKKAAFTHDRLVFVTHALKDLLSAPDFVDILKAEKLSTLPKILKDRVQEGLSA